jgi:hypothetical protein
MFRARVFSAVELNSSFLPLCLRRSGAGSGDCLTIFSSVKAARCLPAAKAARSGSGSTFSDSIQVRLDVWLDLTTATVRKAKWRSASFAGQYRTVQAFIEAYGAHQALRSGGLHPH